MNYHELLYGIPTDQPIVAIDTVLGNSNQLAVYRKSKGKIVREIHRHPYYVYTDMENALIIMDLADIPYDICNGSNVLNVLFYPRDYDEFRWLRANLPDSRCVSVSGAQAFLIQSKQNMFYGLNFDDVTRFSFDLEVYSSGHFPDATKPEDKIIMIACKGPEEKLFRLDEFDSEEDMIVAFLKYFKHVDPDIVINQNIFRFDLPYLETRCEMYGIPLSLGRDGSTPYSFATKMKFAEKEVEYPNYNIHGRHVLDTWFMIMAFDVVYRELEAHDLKTAAKHFKIATEDRVYVPGDEISAWWDEPNKREQLAQYALDDVREALGIDRVLGQSAFYSTLFFPMKHQDVFRYGTGTKIDSIFLRAYVNNKEAYPIPDEAVDIPGGFAYCPAKGHVDGPLTYADVKSLYPTLRRVLDIRPPKDTLGIYAPLMDLVIQERFKSKDLADKYKKEKNPLYEAENAKQNAVKIVINTGNYGWLSWEYGAFNYYAGGQAITENGQFILKKMIELCDGNGYHVTKGDSVTEQTPIYVRRKGSGDVDIMSIGHLHNVLLGGGKSTRVYQEGWETLTSEGWQPIVYSYKHKAEKPVYRVNTKSGYVECTSDHSLFQNGVEVKPTELSVGDVIDHVPYEFDPGSHDLHPDVAWLYGFMVSDGSVSRSYGKSGRVKHNLSIAKRDRDKLEKAQRILQKHFNINTSIYDTIKSSGCLKLIGGYNAGVFDYFNPRLYDVYTHEKKVPFEVLNGNDTVVRAFLEGVLDGDGSLEYYTDGEVKSHKLTSKSQIFIAGWQYLMRKVGHQEFNVSIRQDKPNINNIRCSVQPRGMVRVQEDSIKKIESLDYNKEVYDICTGQGTFVCANGNVLLHNTDGALIQIPSWDELDSFYTWINDEIQEFASQKYGEKNRKEIQITNDGEYEKGLVFDGKSYVLVERGSGELKIKGNTLKSRSMEPYVKSTLREMVLAVLEKDYPTSQMLFEVTDGRLRDRKLTFKEIAKRATLKMGRDEYEHKVTAGNTNRAAAYEIAYGQDHEVPFRKGDPVWYYVKESGYTFKWFKNGNYRISKVKTRVSEQARLEKDFAFDYDIEHYTNRLHNGVKRLLPIFGIDDFKSYFPNIKIKSEDLKKLEDNGIYSDELDSDE